MGYASTSAADMRGHGVPEQLIQFVEQNRAHLQRTATQQHLFRGMVQKPNAPGSSGQASDPESLMPTATRFPHISPQQQAAMPSAGARPPQQPPQQGHPQAGMNLSGANNGQSQQQNPTINSMSTQRSWPSRPTLEQSHQAIMSVQKMKQEFITRSEFPFLLGP